MRPWRRETTFKLLALSLPVIAWLLVDTGLRLAGALPPDDPLVFFSRTFEPSFSPFVPTDDAHLSIRPDWVSDGNGLRDVRGQRPGRIFLLPGFRPSRIAAEKPGGTVRIFVLGGSTTFGLGVGPDDAFAALVGHALEAELPDREVEVVNLGCPGWASGRVANLLARVLDLEPDLVIVYSGHNEMLAGPSGEEAPTDTGEKMTATALSYSPILGWAQHFVSRWRRGRAYDVLAEEAAALEAGRIPVHDPTLLSGEVPSLPEAEYLETSEARYRENLQTMVERSETAGVPLLLVLPVANWSTPPALSAHREGFTNEGIFQTMLGQAQAAIVEQRLLDAIPLLDEAIRISPQYAMAHYWRGSALKLTGEPEKAFASFQWAVDLDARTHRITSRLEKALMETATATDTPWIDLRPLFWQQLRSTPAEELFFDHCHPTRFGHRLIAERLAGVALEMLGRTKGPTPEGMGAGKGKVSRRMTRSSYSIPNEISIDQI